MTGTDTSVIEDILDRLANGRPPEDGPEEDAYYDRYEISETAGDLDSGRGVKVTARDYVTGNGYVITIQRADAEDWLVRRAREIDAAVDGYCATCKGPHDSCGDGPANRPFNAGCPCCRNTVAGL